MSCLVRVLKAWINSKLVLIIHYGTYAASSEQERIEEERENKWTSKLESEREKQRERERERGERADAGVWLLVDEMH